MNDIVLSAYQATIFGLVEDYFSSIGYRGTDLFEDTYVLQKRLAEYIVANIPLNRGNESDEVVALRTYQAVLGTTLRIENPAQPGRTDRTPANPNNGGTDAGGGVTPRNAQAPEPAGLSGQLIQGAPLVN